jgi:hypothetical protein
VRKRCTDQQGKGEQRVKKGNRAKGNDVRDKERSSAVMMRKRSTTHVQEVSHEAKVRTAIKKAVSDGKMMGSL